MGAKKKSSPGIEMPLMSASRISSSPSIASKSKTSVSVLPSMDTVNVTSRSEETLLVRSQGRIRNLGAIDYRIPTSKDLPLELISAAIERLIRLGQIEAESPARSLRGRKTDDARRKARTRDSTSLAVP